MKKILNMKLTKMLLVMGLTGMSIVLISCEKEPGPIGKTQIYGTVTYENGATGKMEQASGAIIKIKYGVKEISPDFDQMYLTFSDGSYDIKGLALGDYYLTAEYTDRFNFKHTHPGFTVSLNNRRSYVNVDFILK